mmetsp:Transcript_9139/g.19760  ORF Transcript_9139/g.19760 Transcript_9139/m.19760 type:complete len:215 (-) Transcript_9139:1068-1712(-)
MLDFSSMALVFSDRSSCILAFMLSRSITIASAAFCNVEISALACFTTASRFATSSLSFSLSAVIQPSLSTHLLCFSSNPVHFVMATSSLEFRSSLSADKDSAWPLKLTRLASKLLILASVSFFSDKRPLISALAFSRLAASSSFSAFKLDKTSSESWLPDIIRATCSFASSRSAMRELFDDTSLEISSRIAVSSDEVVSTFIIRSSFSIDMADS